MYAKLRDRRWTIRWSRLRGSVHGWCCWANRVITLDERETERERLDTAIHEVLHACLPDVSEDAIDATATGLANVLWKLNWRQA